MTKLVPAAVLFAAALAAGCGGTSSANPALTDTPPVTAEVVGQQVEVAANRLVQILNGITDDQSARMNTPQLRAGAQALSFTAKQYHTLAGAADAAGPAATPPAASARPGQLPPTAERLLTALERVAKAPYGASIQGELDGVLAAGADMLPPADRSRYLEEARKRGLTAGEAPPPATAPKDVKEPSPAQAPRPGEATKK